MAQPIARHDATVPKRPAVVARFDSVIGIAPERDELTVLDRALAERSRRVLTADVRYVDWPPTGFGARLGQRWSIETVLLARIKAALDFGAGLSAADLDDLDGAIRRTWPAFPGRATRTLLALRRAGSNASVRRRQSAPTAPSNGGTSMVGRRCPRCRSRR